MGWSGMGARKLGRCFRLIYARGAAGRPVAKRRTRGCRTVDASNQHGKRHCRRPHRHPVVAQQICHVTDVRRLSGGERLFDLMDELFEREGFCQEGELALSRQMSLKGILGIAGDEDDLRAGLRLRSSRNNVGPSISGMTTSDTTRSTLPSDLSRTSMASTPLAASSTV